MNQKIYTDLNSNNRDYHYNTYNHGLSMRHGNVRHVHYGREEADHKRLQKPACVCREKTKAFHFPNPTKEEDREDQARSEGYSKHIQLALA